MDLELLEGQSIHKYGGHLSPQMCSGSSGHPSETDVFESMPTEQTRKMRVA